VPEPLAARNGGGAAIFRRWGGTRPPHHCIASQNGGPTAILRAASALRVRAALGSGRDRLAKAAMGAAGPGKEHPP
jgi:hypothetical protein